MRLTRWTGDLEKVGFNGPMLPVLEDCVLSPTLYGSLLTLRVSVCLSAVCSAGLDTTVSLPGAAAVRQRIFNPSAAFHNRQIV